ncbi:PucR family transcriptional regulator [Streptomyces sp. NPDC004393]|uniref:PucR family transcriptional regulator n=1 Tax=Streptomyces sp. NPDC004533 TaxID=3154278 RepID=UPI0033BF5D1A
MSDNDVVQWLASYAAHIQRGDLLEQVALGIDQEITLEVPELAADEQLLADLHSSTRANWRGILQVIAREPYEVLIQPAAFDLAHTIARRGLELGVLLKTYRVGQRAMWRYITRTLDEQVADVTLRSAVLVHFWDRVTEWLDTTVEALIKSYTEERQQAERSVLARRIATVCAIRRGNNVDVDAASRVLGHPLRLHHTAFVLWADETATDANLTRALEGLAGELASALGAPRPLTLSSGARGLWGWAATRHLPDPDVLTDLRVSKGGVRAAIGCSAPGLAGFRRSNHEALAAQRVAIAGRQNRLLTRYSDVELVSLATGHGGLDAIRTFVERELGALAEADDATARLRQTAAAYLAKNSNARAAGELLGVHFNTVRYRIRRVEELLGRPIEERRTHVEMALRCADAYGEQVLPTVAQPRSLVMTDD